MFNFFGREQWTMMASSLIAGMAGAMIMQIVFARHPAGIATIDVTGMVQGYIRETASQPLSMQEKQQKISHFASLLSKTADDLAHEKNVVLLLNESVVAGGSDLTQQAKEMIRKGFAA